jgi:hypothetical protein
MRKRIVRLPSAQPAGDSDQSWLDLQQIATVEVTSEDPAFPIECIFGYDYTRYWRAAETGQQSIRIVFDEPQSLKRIKLVFKETERERTQEFSISWSGAAGGTTKELLRQRWNFSPNGSTTEVENYGVDLTAVSVLELVIQPDVAKSDAFATLAQWCVR